VAGTAVRYEAAIESLLPTGDAIRRAIVAALAAAKLESYHVGHVNAQGNSTREDDPIEARAIRDTLGNVPVTAPKSFFGNLGCGSGTAELVVSLIALARDVIPPTLNYETPDPECPVNVVREAQRPESRTFIKLSHNVTGHAAAVIITAL
jgi:3-oxoacyl-[acyl-carrier-protein] synthase II